MNTDNDKIIYTAYNDGVDGRQPRLVVAAYSPTAFDGACTRYQTSCRNSLRLTKQVVDIAEAKKLALSKLNALDKLVLGIK